MGGREVLRGHTSKQAQTRRGWPKGREAGGISGVFLWWGAAGAALESTLPNREEPIGFRVLILDSSTWAVNPFGVPGPSPPQRPA